MYVLCTLASNSVPWCRKFISLFLDRRNESVRENKVQSSIRRLNLWFSFVPAWKSHIDIDVFYKIQFAVVYRNTRTIVSRFTGVTLIFIKKRGGEERKIDRCTTGYARCTLYDMTDRSTVGKFDHILEAFLCDTFVAQSCFSKSINTRLFLCQLGVSEI